MTLYEHVMLGIDGALAAGLQRRYGWQIVALAGCTAALPDWDALSILVGFQYYAGGHRVWGHNLVVAGVLAAAVSTLCHRFDLLTKAQHWLGRHWSALAMDNPPKTPIRSTNPLGLWLVVGVLAAYSHLLMDTLFSRCQTHPVWKVPLLWPFAPTGWAWPWMAWGDLGVTVIFAGGMFAMVRWRHAAQKVAVCTLALVAAYIAVRGAMW